MADMARQAITGHSMGGHGALTTALRNPGRFPSVSAFAPIVSPMACPWGDKALGGYLGADRADWRAYDACALIEDGARLPELLVDQGEADAFHRSAIAAIFAQHGMRRAVSRHHPHAARLRSFLLFHLDLHGRTCRMACKALKT
jgi:S-formylglutathione hydrolase